jgi:hypothetical protein
MRHVWMLLLIGLATVVEAQTPRFDLFGGYSFLHERGDLNSHGWNVAATWNFHRYFGLTADIAGHYRSDSRVVPVTTPVLVSARTRVHSFTFGPTFALHNRTRLIPFAHALIGLNRLTVETSGTLPSSSSSVNNYSHNLGGGLDVRITRRFAVRAAQLDVNVVRFPGGFWQDNFRYSTGIVVRFGSRWRA